MGDVNAMIETAERLGPTPLPEPIASYEDETDPQVRGAWEITTLTEADWALRRKGECEAELAEVDALERAHIAEIRARAESLRRRARTGIAFFDFKLLVFMERHRSDLVKGKAKSRPLIYGRLGWRAKPERLVVKNEEALAVWLRAQPAGSPLVRWKVEPVMDAIQEQFRAQGLIPDGMDVQPETDEPYAKPELPDTKLAKGRK